MSNGPGSKPAALHTEYVEEEVGGPAYGTQDLVFYLLRADADEGDSGINDIAEEAGFGEDVLTGGDDNFAGNVWSDSSNSFSPIGADGAAGAVPDYGSTQSGLNQVAQEELRQSFGEPEGRRLFTCAAKWAEIYRRRTVRRIFTKCLVVG